MEAADLEPVTGTVAFDAGRSSTGTETGTVSGTTLTTHLVDQGLEHGHGVE